MLDKKTNKKYFFSLWTLIWWQVDSEEIERQIVNYNTFKIHQSARGVAFIFALLIASGATYFNYTAQLPYYWMDGLLFTVFGLLVSRGYRWAIIMTMAWWTFGKFSYLYDLLANTPYGVQHYPSNKGVTFILQILWWAWYMNVLYTAFRVECKRRKLKLTTAPLDSMNSVVLSAQEPAPSPSKPPHEVREVDSKSLKLEIFKDNRVLIAGFCGVILATFIFTLFSVFHFNIFQFGTFNLERRDSGTGISIQLPSSRWKFSSMSEIGQDESRENDFVIKTQNNKVSGVIKAYPYVLSRKDFEDVANTIKMKWAGYGNLLEEKFTSSEARLIFDLGKPYGRVYTIYKQLDHLGVVFEFIVEEGVKKSYENDIDNVIISVSETEQAKQISVDYSQTEQKKIEKNELKQRKTVFLSQCVNILNIDYRNGNNHQIEAAAETEYWTNDYGDVTRVEISPEFYIAKGYFEKMLESINELDDIDSETLQVKSKLEKAAALRQESIQLITEGYMLKQRIGSASISNKLVMAQNILNLNSENAYYQSTKTVFVPEYHGEVEDGNARERMADVYIIDAIGLLVKMSDENANGKYTSALKEGLKYYLSKSYSK